jgi:hypothetical protein
MLLNDLTSNNPLLEGTQQSLSSPPRPGLTVIQQIENEAKTSTSQS